jgi:hypothetical protein
VSHISLILALLKAFGIPEITIMVIPHCSLTGFVYVEVNIKRPPLYSQDRIRARGSHLQHPLSACNRTTQQSSSPKLQKSDVHNKKETSQFAQSSLLITTSILYQWRVDDLQLGMAKLG